MVNGRDRRAHFGSQTSALTCSREPKTNPNAMVPESGLRTATVSWTHGVPHPRNSRMRSPTAERRPAHHQQTTRHRHLCAQKKKERSESRASGCRARLPRQGALDRAKHVALLFSLVGGEHTPPWNKADWCCHSVQAEPSSGGCNRKVCRSSKSAATNGSRV